MDHVVDFLISLNYLVLGRLVLSQSLLKLKDRLLCDLKTFTHKCIFLLTFFALLCNVKCLTQGKVL